MLGKFNISLTRCEVVEQQSYGPIICSIFYVLVTRTFYTPFETKVRIQHQSFIAAFICNTSLFFKGWMNRNKLTTADINILGTLS